MEKVMKRAFILILMACFCLVANSVFAKCPANSDRVINKMKQKEPPIIENIPEKNLENFSQEKAYIEIPRNIRSLKETNINDALQWRMKTRRLFESAFQKDYVVTDIVFSKDKKRVFYKLYNRFAIL